MKFQGKIVIGIFSRIPTGRLRKTWLLIDDQRPPLV